MINVAIGPATAKTHVTSRIRTATRVATLLAHASGADQLVDQANFVHNLLADLSHRRRCGKGSTRQQKSNSEHITMEREAEARANEGADTQHATHTAPSALAKAFAFLSAVLFDVSPAPSSI
jgi:hypothetical protein